MTPAAIHVSASGVITEMKKGAHLYEKKIVIVEYVSTGINYIDDVRARGYEPVLVEGHYVATRENLPILRNMREEINARLRGSVQIIPENPDYGEVLRQVRRDCELLHTLEMKYPRILFQGETLEEHPVSAPRNIEAVLQEGNCHGATLVFSDTAVSIEGANVVSPDGLKSAYNSYEQGILDLSDPDSFSDLESVIQQIYVFAGKIRPGGRILVPESTYCHLPYGLEGMEILLRVAGLRIELPSAGEIEFLTASVPV